MSGKMRWSFLD